MIAIRYRACLEQPVLATALLGDPNSSASLNYLPGSLMRGVLIARYLKHKAPVDAATDAHWRSLFFDSSTRYLHAYPLSGGGERSIPTPRSCLLPKNANLEEWPTLYNASAAEWDARALREAEEEADDQLRPVGWPFCVAGEGSIELLRPRRTISVHIQRDRRSGRPGRQHGAVFQYDALAEGQWFGGVILTTDAHAAQIRALFTPDICWLGRSRTAEYGRTRLEYEGEDQDWREIGGEAGEIPAGTPATLSFLSDALLRDKDGQPVAAPDDDTLSEYLGVSVRIDQSGTFTGSVEVGGFNSTWRLPLVQSQAIAAGSVVRFEPQETMSGDSVRRLEEQGLGDRRAEGFGRIAFNWPEDVEYAAREGGAHARSRAISVTSEEGLRMARVMARRRLDAAIDDAIVMYVRDQVINPGRRVADEVMNNQLARLRELVRRASPDDGTSFVLERFDQFKPTARRQFERATLEDKRLVVWVTELLSRPESVWDRFGGFVEPSVAGQRVERDSGLARAAALRLLAAILDALMQKRRGGAS